MPTSILKIAYHLGVIGIEIWKYFGWDESDDWKNSDKVFHKF